MSETALAPHPAAPVEKAPWAVKTMPIKSRDLAVSLAKARHMEVGDLLADALRVYAAGVPTVRLEDVRLQVETTAAVMRALELARHNFERARPRTRDRADARRLVLHLTGLLHQVMGDDRSRVIAVDGQLVTERG